MNKYAKRRQSLQLVKTVFFLCVKKLRRKEEQKKGNEKHTTFVGTIFYKKGEFIYG